MKNLQNRKGYSFTLEGRNLPCTENATFMPLSENIKLLQNIAYVFEYNTTYAFYKEKEQKLVDEYELKEHHSDEEIIAYKKTINDLSNEYDQVIERLREATDKCELDAERIIGKERLCEISKHLTTIEELYDNMYSSDKPVDLLEVDDDNMVVLPKEQKYHAVYGNPSLERMESFSEIGIVASEWFGELESEGEGRFCSFIQDDSRNKRPGTNRSMKFYIDTTSELGKKMAALDYFEYEHIKKTNPERLKDIYGTELIEMFEFISSWSGCGGDFHEDENSSFYTWMAIPGGIPPKLIVGIELTKDMEELKDPSVLKKLSAMFPNAVIFDEDEKVLSRAKNEQKPKEKE